MSSHTRINHQIKATELRVIGEKGENLGVLSLRESLTKAEEAGLDLIEISPNANPPIAKIMDYGKYQYAENKKLKASKAKVRTVEVKTLQIKIGTGEHDLNLKAKRVGEWLREGNRVRLDLFLPGRAKYLDEKFLRERMDRFLKLIPENYKVSEEPKKSPKGMSALVEKAR